MDRFIPLSVPNFAGNEKKYVDDAIMQGWVSTGGAYVEKLEKRLASFLGISDVAVCQSGTAGIHLSLIDCGIQPGDMVIVPVLTFIAAVNPVRYQFAEPVFMDCDDSLCINPEKLRNFCEEECTMVNGRLIHNESEKHVKAVIVVHVFGNMADMEAIMETAQKYNLIVIEDATEALGTYYLSGRYKGRYAGTIGDYGVYSFNGNKIITTGGGGAVTARNTKNISHIRYISTQAKDDPYYYVHNEVGYNYRMTNVQASIGVAQMEELEDFIKCKNENYVIYKKLFEDFKYGKIMDFCEKAYCNKWFYSLEIPIRKLKCSLRDIITELGYMGVQTRAIWGLINEQKPYKNFQAYKIEKALYYGSCVLNLPCSTNITNEEINYVAEQVKNILEGFAFG
ncbi:MAG: LegC family aminotransferase [Lachnospiraceae bacterium]|nr:LegC family aminotransferase [Lachnospiraceae bacterium]